MIFTIIQIVFFIAFFVLHGYHDYKAYKYYLKYKADSDTKEYEIALNEHRYKAIINLCFSIVFAIADNSCITAHC